MRKKILALVLPVLVACAPARAAVYRIDPARTEVSFDIRNFASNVRGEFREFDGTVDYDAARPESASASGTIRVKSVDTKNRQRDAHLLTKSFFDAGRVPEIAFKSTGVRKQADGSLRVEGLLKIRGVERSVTLEARDLAVSDGRLTFHAQTKIDRRDFGINYAAGVGALALGNGVTIRLDVTAMEAK